MASNNDDRDDDNDRPLELPILKQPANRYNSRQQQTYRVDSASQSHSQREHVTHPVDPRFNPKCSGSNDLRHFAKNYAFLDEIRQKEIEQLEKALRREKDGNKKDQIKLTLNRLRNKVVENKNKQKRLEVIDELRSKGKGSSKRGNYNYVHKTPQREPSSSKLLPSTQQQSDTNPISHNRAQERRPPTNRNKFVKKSDIKKRMLVEKYKELKGSGKLSKYLERKRKKLISRDELKMR